MQSFPQDMSHFPRARKYSKSCTGWRKLGLYQTDQRWTSPQSGVREWWWYQNQTDSYGCVDLKPLNECVRREVHPLPRVDGTLTQLTGAKVF